MLSMLVLVLVQLLSMLALAVVLSGYERRARCMAMHPPTRNGRRKCNAYILCTVRVVMK